MAHDDDRAAPEPGEPADDRFVIAEVPVAGEFLELLEDRADEIREVWPVGMARHLRDAPGIEIGVDLLQLLGRFGLQLGQLVGDRRTILARGKGFQFGDLGIELGDRFFEFEIGCHARSLAIWPRFA